jgi:hypothetical protein
VSSTLEATAPCRLELIGGPLVGALPTDGVLRLAVALDRRVLCRVEPRPSGLEIHSKDTGERVVADDARDVPEGPAARVARMLVATGVHSGLRVVTHVRVPEDAGLGTDSALQVAVSAALGLGGAEILERGLLADGGEGNAPAPSDLHAALFGGAHVLRIREGVVSIERIGADPARIEECLSLVDPGPVPMAASPVMASSADAALRASRAIAAGAYDEMSALLSAVHRGRVDSAAPAVRRLVEGIERAGGAAWPSGRLIAVWAVPGARSPGPREAVAALVKEAGLRSFPARVDLRGLEVE